MDARTRRAVSVAVLVLVAPLPFVIRTLQRRSAEREARRSTIAQLQALAEVVRAEHRRRAIPIVPDDGRWSSYKELGALIEQAESHGVSCRAFANDVYRLSYPDGWGRGIHYCYPGVVHEKAGTSSRPARTASSKPAPRRWAMTSWSARTLLP